METKQCGKCKIEKPVCEFYKCKRDGYRSRCKSCHRLDLKLFGLTGYWKRYQREYYQRPEVKEGIRKRKNEYRKLPRVRIKNLARYYTRHEIRAGRINREACAMCDKEQSEAHHLDYNQPLMIVWLCVDCHRAVHYKESYQGEKK